MLSIRKQFIVPAALILGLSIQMILSAPLVGAATYQFENRPPECSDQIDNDRDGDIDFPEDLDCESPHDNKEIITQPKSLKIHVTDGKQYAKPDEELVYRIVVSNKHGYARDYTLKTELHPFINFLDATGNPTVDGRTVEWRNLFIEEGEVQEFLVATYVERSAVDNTAMQLRVFSKDSLATDTTSVLRDTPSEAFGIALYDGQQGARVGEELLYTIVITNDSNELATGVDVNFAMPIHSEFVDAIEGGHWTGKHVRWEGLTISPYGERTLEVLIRVRSDAPLGNELRASAESRGKTAVDITTVGNASLNDGRQTGRYEPSPIALSKTADRAEVRPGDTVSYTVTLKNNTNQTMTNLLVQDRMDMQYMRVLGAQHGQMEGDRITWVVDSLAPGEKWSVRYTVQISPYVPEGVSLKNVVSVSGDGIEEYSLTERVSTGNTKVISTLPKTGGDISVLFAGLTSIFGLASVFGQKRLVL